MTSMVQCLPQDPLHNKTDLACIDIASSRNRFFKPVNVNKIQSLIESVQTQKLEITQLCQFMNLGGNRAFYDLLKANKKTTYTLYEDTFDVDKGHKYVDAQAWQKALVLIDVMDYMPTAKCKEWNELIKNCDTPPFNEAYVPTTLIELLNSRDMFLAETVSDIFFGLSGDHVTNEPNGFKKRMIMPSKYPKGTSEPSQDVQSLVGDLRAIIAKFHNLEVASHKNTQAVITACRYNPGKWMDVDGHSLRLKVFKVGTIHIEVHSDIAWRLNEILASKYPKAIPSAARKPEVRRANVRPMRFDTISSGAITILANLKTAYNDVGHNYRPHHVEIEGCYGLDGSYAYGHDKKLCMKEAVAVCLYLGATLSKSFSHENAVRFNEGVDVKTLIRKVVALGCLPEKISHQFYPTPEWLSFRVREWAEINEDSSVCDPQTGKGSLIKGLNNVHCIELSPVHCAILESMGHTVICGDFLIEAEKMVGKFDRILMNPPFFNGQAKLHFETALTCLDNNGICVAILPASLIDSFALDGFTFEYSEIIHNAFYEEGAGVSVFLVKATKT